MWIPAIRRAWYRVSQEVDVSPMMNRADAFAGELTELAADRVRLRLARWMEPGMPVSVEWNQTQLRGMVELCQPRRDGYAAEVRLDDVNFVADLRSAAWRPLFEPELAGV